MDAIYRLGEATVGEVLEQLPDPPSYSSVRTIIRKLEAKGLAERKSVGRATEVYPTEKSLTLQPLIQNSWKGLKERYTEILGEELTKRLTADVYEASQKLTI